MALTPQRQIDGYVAFMQQIASTSFASSQQGDSWLVTLNGQQIFSVPDQSIADTLANQLQQRLTASGNQAKAQTKAAIIALINGL